MCGLRDVTEKDLDLTEMIDVQKAYSDADFVVIVVPPYKHSESKYEL